MQVERTLVMVNVVCVYVGFEEVGDLVGGYVVSCDSNPYKEFVFT